VFEAAGTVEGFALVVYLLCRVVSGAKKAGRTGSSEILATLLLALGIGIAPAPPREVKIELKRDQTSPAILQISLRLNQPEGRRNESQNGRLFALSTFSRDRGGAV